jgi:hypothetical protein
MDLGNRGSRNWDFVKRRKQRFERSRELALDQNAGLRSGEWRQAVLQARQIEGDLFAEKIGSGREELAELDKARTQLAECRSETLTRTR